MGSSHPQTTVPAVPTCSKQTCSTHKQLCTDDMREASSIPMIKYLNKKKSNIRYYDPSGEKYEFKKLKNVKYYDDISSACFNSDLIVLHTEWNDFKLLNFKKIVKKKKFKVFDMRNIYSPSIMKKLKIDYFGIGR